MHRFTPSVPIVEHGDERDADDRALRRLQPGNRLTPRPLPRWMQQFVSGLLEFLCCRTYRRRLPETSLPLRSGGRSVLGRLSEVGPCP